MKNKTEILNSIRQHRLETVELPSLDDSETWIVYEDLRSQFVAAVKSVGGHCAVVGSVDQLNERLSERAEYQSAARICSLIAQAGSTNVDLDQIDDAHELEDVDYAILPGEFGVAENGAVWVNDAGLKHRALYFIVQHLALVLPADALVNNMHEAYARLKANAAADGKPGPFAEPGFGTFLSGPSKTADIEQSLVMGAHGPRSLSVFLLER